MHGRDVIARQSRFLTQHLNDPALAVDNHHAAAERRQRETPARQHLAVVELMLLQERIRLRRKGRERLTVVQKEAFFAGTDEYFFRVIRHHHVHGIFGKSLAAGHLMQRIAYHLQQTTVTVSDI